MAAAAAAVAVAVALASVWSARATPPAAPVPLGDAARDSHPVPAPAATDPGATPLLQAGADRGASPAGAAGPGAASDGAGTAAAAPGAGPPAIPSPTEVGVAPAVQGGAPAASPGRASWRLPLEGRSLTPFGWTYSATLGDWRFHDGIDIEAPVGAPVAAAADGTVAEVRRDPMWGWIVRQQAPGGIEFVYEALGEVTVAPGSPVKAGDVVGRVGPSPLAESGLPPHLHFSVRRGGSPVPPSGP